MSRAYKISIRESIRRVVKGSDHISTKLELLELLPRETMAEILKQELAEKGFKETGKLMVRVEDDVTISIDPETGEVKVSSEITQEIELEKTGTGYGDADDGQSGRRAAEERIRKQTLADLEDQAAEKQQKLTEKATEQLEEVLRNIQGELDGVVNRVTAKALKEKAAQIGEIKSVTEDTDNGSMTIVLEV